jgi:hypothetical protein
MMAAFTTLQGAGGMHVTWVSLCAGGFETRPYNCATINVVS